VFNFMPRGGVGDTPSIYRRFSKKSKPTFAKWSKLLNKEGVNVFNFMPRNGVGDAPSSIEDFQKNQDRPLPNDLNY